MIYLIRANHANEFELQNYKAVGSDLHINIITSQHPLTPVSLPTTKLWSPTDLPNMPFRRQLLNRLFGGEQWLIGLEKQISKPYNDLRRALGVNHCIVHTAETYAPYTHQSVQLRKYGIISKLVCTCWETIPHANEKFARLRKWKQEAYEYIDLFHAPTQRAKQALITEGVDPKKIVVIPYGVDLTRFHPLDLSGDSRKARPLILTVARLEKEKGIEDIEGVAQSLPGCDFLIIGSGSYHPTGSNITTCSMPYSEIHKVYQKASLFFLPSRTTDTWEEQYGMSLIEAMACGLPIVTTDSGAIPEVVGEAGIIGLESDIAAMASNILQIISSKSITTKLSKLSLARAKKYYDAKKVASKLTSLYL